MPAASPLTDPPVASVAEAIQRLQAIQAQLAADDGVRHFNRMYLEVTEAFQQRVGAGFFQDPPFMERLQFAIAGMNAHINFDLPRALVETCRVLGTTPDAGSHHRDFKKVDEILAEIEPKVRDELKQEFPLDDRELEHLRNVLEIWSITRARQAAWDQSELLWWLRGNAVLTAAHTEVLDRFVGFAGRGLLIPLI
jgi:Family of unknown function (DUF5995)